MFKVGDKVRIKSKRYNEGEYDVIGYIINEYQCYLLAHGYKFDITDLKHYIDPLETLVADTYRKLKEKSKTGIRRDKNKTFAWETLSPEEQDFINRAEEILPELKK